MMRPLPAVAIAVPLLAILLAIVSPLPEVAALATIVGAAAVIVIALPLAIAVYFDKNVVRQSLYFVGILMVSYWAVRYTTNFGSLAAAQANFVTKSYRWIKPQDYTWHEWHAGKYYRLSVQAPGVLRVDIDRNCFMLDTGDRNKMGGQHGYLHIRTYIANESTSAGDLRSDEIFGAQAKRFTREPFRFVFVAWDPFPSELFDEFVGPMYASLKVEAIEEPSSAPTLLSSSPEPLYLAKDTLAGYATVSEVDHAVTLIFKTLELDPAQSRLKAQVAYHQWRKDFSFTIGQTMDVFGFNITLASFEAGGEHGPRAKLYIKDSDNRDRLYKESEGR
jgi:hypothetical protein